MSTRIAIAVMLAVILGAPAMAMDSQATLFAAEPMVIGLFWGVILLPMLYDIAFYWVLKERFMLWHAARALAIIAYSIGTIPIDLPLLPPPGSEPRWWMNMLGFGFMVAMAGPFLRTYLEQGTISPNMARALDWSFPFIILLTMLGTVRDLPGWLFMMKELSYIPFIALIIFALTQAARNGSRAARFQIVGWVPAVVVCSGILACNIVEIPLPYYTVSALLAAVAFEFGIVGAGIANRVLTMQRQRDAALLQAETSSRLARTDALTNLPNRRGLSRRYDDMQRDDGAGAAAIALVDLDHFKRVNDRHGHDVGDNVLITLGEAMRETPDVYAARMGGEEFALLIFDPLPEVAVETMRTSLAAYIAQRVPGLSFPVTVSIGLTRLVQGEPMLEALRRADEHLYIAKRNGRDQSSWSEIPAADLKAAA
ncbi:MAG: diguanylate cyclase [Pacificimonas sp.]